ncbi:MAG: class I SAM-dependent methyltransferase [Opitutaceae bacterium]|nr:class I SAM-dependent methyltransferase [Opitutaceae bacterium]
MSADYIPALRYRCLTPAYDSVLRLTTRETTFKAALVRQALAAPGRRCLDVGSGTGTLSISLKLAAPSLDVVGVDADPGIIARARHKAAGRGVAVRFDQALAFSLPYADGEFDRVVSSLFFHHLTWEDKVRTATELFRVLAPGGELHLADWGRPSGPLMRVLFLTVQMLDGFATTRDHARGRLPELLHDAGFSAVLETERFATPCGTLSLFRALRP